MKKNKSIKRFKTFDEYNKCLKYSILSYLVFSLAFVGFYNLILCGILGFIAFLGFKVIEKKPLEIDVVENEVSKNEEL